MGKLLFVTIAIGVVAGALDAPLWAILLYSSLMFYIYERTEYWQSR